MKILMIVVGLLLVLSWILNDDVHAKKKQVQEDIEFKAYYIVPTLSSTTYDSPCSQFRYHNGSFSCFVMNMNEFVDYQDSVGRYDSILYRFNRLIVFLSGLHYVNCAQKQQWSDKPSFWVNIIGVGDVTVACLTEFHFLLDEIQHITVSNI